MAKESDPEEKVIVEAMKILLTSDGKGRLRKAIALSELCCTMNANKVRDHITKLIETKELV